MIYISKPYFDIKEWRALRGPLFSGWVTQGPYAAKFESDFAKLHGVNYAVSAANCTVALHMALIAMEIVEGDEVIVPSFTWVSTANAVEYAGAKPVFCDINKETYNVDVSKIESLITAKTKAVIPVHLFGLCADMNSLIKICKRRKIRIIEDAACGVGASYKDKMAGSFGDIGCFSFHPRKIVTTGEGGICTTNNKELKGRLMCLRNHGASLSTEEALEGPKPYLLPDFNILGFNYRMTDIQAAIGIVQLHRVNKLIKERRFWAKWYKKELGGISWLKTPVVEAGYGHTYQAFVCYVDEGCAPASRNKIMEILQSKGIYTRPGTHAVHMLKYYKKKYGLEDADFPCARDCYKYTITLPLHNRMKAEDYRYIVKTLRAI